MQDKKPTREELETISPTNRLEWRQWLEKHHKDKNAIWLIYFKKSSGNPTISYDDAVEEALCFGWIDSIAKKVDEKRHMQYFSKRKPKSVWSKINKAKIERLIDEGLMTPAGLACVEIAKANGSWTILDDVEALIIPADLESAFQASPKAYDFFKGLSKSNKQMMLGWLKLAKKPETRQRRIEELIEQGEQGKKPKQFR